MKDGSRTSGSLLDYGEQRRVSGGAPAPHDCHPPLPESDFMWSDSEVAGLLDAEGRITVVSRNEEEARVHDVCGKRARDLVNPQSRPTLDKAMEEVRRGNSAVICISGTGDDGECVWCRAHLMPSPVEEAPVLFHLRRLPKAWHHLSDRERDVVHSLHDCGMNPKKAAKALGMSVHTLNAHRRSITKKCDLRGIGDFWVFVERCR